MSLSARNPVARKRRLTCDEAVLAGRAELLDRSDRDLLLGVWVHRGSVELMAHLAGRHPQTIRRRVRKLLERIESTSFLSAARALALLPARQAEIAKLHFCQKRSLRQIARHCGLSLHEVRRQVHEIRGALAGIDAFRREAKAS